MNIEQNKTNYTIYYIILFWMLYTLYCYNNGSLLYAIKCVRWYILYKMGVAAICHNHFPGFCHIVLNGLSYMPLESPWGPFHPGHTAQWVAILHLPRSEFWICRTVFWCCQFDLGVVSGRKFDDKYLESVEIQGKYWVSNRRKSCDDDWDWLSWTKNNSNALGIMAHQLCIIV